LHIDSLSVLQGKKINATVCMWINKDFYRFRMRIFLKFMDGQGLLLKALWLSDYFREDNRPLEGWKPINFSPS